jgi:hypothetical protein
MFYLGILRMRLTITLIRVLKVVKLTARKIQFQWDRSTVPSYGLQTYEMFFFKFLTKVKFSVEFFKKSLYIYIASDRTSVMMELKSAATNYSWFS